MKNYPSLLLVGLLLFAATSCGTYQTYTGILDYNAGELNEITKTAELNSLMNSTQPIKFVLREPENFSDYTHEEKEGINNLFGQIEKELIRQGQIVKDRRLLNLLLDKNHSNITFASNALDTDVIVEIIDLGFDIPNKIYDFGIKEKGIKTNFHNWNNIDFINCELSMMECRVTLVKEGNVGGIFKFYVSGCDDNNSFFVKIYEDMDGSLDQSKESFVGWNHNNVSFKSLVQSYNMNDLSRNKAISKLVTALLEQLGKSPASQTKK